MSPSKQNKKDKQMRKVVLSSLAALALTTAANASATKFYVDDNGQVFTKPGEGRKALKEDTPWYSHADKLKFSVQSFLGYKYHDYDTFKDANNQTVNVANTSTFEIRRAYFQVKAYMMEDPKSYYRITFDVSKDTTGDEKVRAKYAYVYLNEVLPATGVEVGLAHRPWHDYEEHNAWYYRSISKILVETRRAGDLSNSADFGFMFKTRTKYFDADYGLFNGEGYHSYNIGKGLSFEWRATAHLLGTSSHHHPEKNTYFDASFFGQLNQDHRSVKDSSNTVVDTKDMNFYGVHAVYNMPSFLIAAQYVDCQVDKYNGKADSKAGKGWSVNMEGRIGAEKQYKGFARYDDWKPEADDGAKEYHKKSYVIGAAWKQNKNLEWVVNATVKDYDEGILKNLKSADFNGDHINGIDYMITAEVNF